jgi:predicted nucleic acid-binding protein
VFVLDASVAIAWFVGKQATAYTNRLRVKAKREPLHVLLLWRFEETASISSAVSAGLFSFRRIYSIYTK